MNFKVSRQLRTNISSSSVRHEYLEYQLGVEKCLGHEFDGYCFDGVVALYWVALFSACAIHYTTLRDWIGDGCPFDVISWDAPGLYTCGDSILPKAS
jgi:hypothetical protein